MFKVVADFIDDKTTIDNRRHRGKIQDEVVVNIVLATFQANMFR